MAEIFFQSLCMLKEACLPKDDPNSAVFGLIKVAQRLLREKYEGVYLKRNF